MLRQGEEGCSSVAAGRSIWGQCLGHLLGTAGLGGAQPGAAVGRSPREQPGAGVEETAPKTQPRPSRGHGGTRHCRGSQPGRGGMSV